MAHRLLRHDGSERSDFPIVCESCLGDNPYLRMTKAHRNNECKICTRPFTVFRWRPGRDARYKKTEICQTCARLKNVCQVCLLDQEYGLPVQVRDSALGVDTNVVIPRSDVNREYFAEELDRRTRTGVDYESSYYGKVRPNDTILKLMRTEPYYKRNRAHVCSFYVRGECKRGAECPYRHEMPVTGELSQQNIKDRYYGVNDPVASMLLKKAREMTSLEPPEDETVRTLYVGGLDGTKITEDDIRDIFYAYGEMESIRLVSEKACAFVTYSKREGAEAAVESLANKLVVKGMRLKLMWGRTSVPKSPQLEDHQDLEHGASKQSSITVGLETHDCCGMLLPRSLVSQCQQNQEEPHVGYHEHAAYRYFNIPTPSSSLPGGRPLYPSMDPQRMGSVLVVTPAHGTAIPNPSGDQNLAADPSMTLPQYARPSYAHQPSSSSPTESTLTSQAST